MPEINLPTKTAQDAIKLKTDLIGIPNPTIADNATVMNYLKKIEDIVSFAGGTEWSKYRPFSKVITNSVAEKTAIVNITGSGYVSKILAVSSSPTAASMLIITIDDEVVFRGVLNTDKYAWAHGIVLEDYIGFEPPSNLFVIVDGKSTSNVMGPTSSYPMIDNANTGTIRLANPIFFKKSLKIETESYASDNTIKCNVVGGIG